MIYFRDFVPSGVNLPSPDPLQRAQNQLNRGDILFSACRNFQLTLLPGGNLVLYAIDDTSLPPYQVPEAPAVIPNATYPVVIWESRSDDEGVTRCNMQTDGNLVLYDDAGVPHWASGTNGHPGTFLRCQCDGNLVLLAPDGSVLKNTNTNAGKH
jgi:hypothetical protein